MVRISRSVAGSGADDHLGRLARGCELRGLCRFAAVFVGLVLARGNLVHRGFDDRRLLFGGELDEVLLGGELDVGAQAVGEEPGLLDEVLAGSGNCFKVDVAAEVMFNAEGPGDVDELLHGVVRRLDDARGEKEAFDVVALVKVECEFDDLFGSEAGALNVGGDAVDAEDAVVGAEVGEENFEQGDAAAVRRVAVADAHAVGVAHALTVAAAFGTRGGAGGVVFRSVGENLEFLLDVHAGTKI